MNLCGAKRGGASSRSLDEGKDLGVDRRREERRGKGSKCSGSANAGKKMKWNHHPLK